MHVRRSLLSLAVAAAMALSGCSNGERDLVSAASEGPRQGQALWDYDQWFETARMQSTAQASNHDWVRALPWLGVMPVLAAAQSS